MASALGFGDNTRATLITRGLAETARLGVVLGADPLTFAGLAGLGDLVATCCSPLSRNRTFGEHLGRGESLEQAQVATRQTAEGVKSCLAIRDLADRNDVEMPITEQVERVCHEGLDPRIAVAALMSRETKPERPATAPAVSAPGCRIRYRDSRSCPGRYWPRRTTSTRPSGPSPAWTGTGAPTTRPGAGWSRRSGSWRGRSASSSAPAWRPSPGCC